LYYNINNTHRKSIHTQETHTTTGGEQKRVPIIICLIGSHLQATRSTCSSRTQRWYIVDDNSTGNYVTRDKFQFTRTVKGRIKIGQRQFYIEWLDGYRSWEPDTNFDEDLIEDHHREYTRVARSAYPIYGSLTIALGPLLVFSL